MLSIALYLLTHAMLLSLHLSGGSFPRPLSAQEEKKYVERMLAGDIEARNVLVEHNLRLVAHIAKKYYTQSDEQDDLIVLADDNGFDLRDKRACGGGQHFVGILHR